MRHGDGGGAAYRSSALCWYGQGAGALAIASVSDRHMEARAIFAGTRDYGRSASASTTVSAVGRPTGRVAVAGVVGGLRRFSR
jgi:hypothetical protein